MVPYSWDIEVEDNELPDICLRCKFRSMIRYFLEIPFCYQSSNSCWRRHGKKHCPDYVFKGNKQLEIIFD